MVIKVGDIHRQWRWFKIATKDFEKGTSFIQVGDFGAGLWESKDYEKKMINSLKSTLQKREHFLYVVRGNHDDPGYFEGQHMYDHLKLVPDYHIENIEGNNHLFIGGAVSADRSTLIKDYEWWPTEVFNFDWDRICQIRGIDTVIAHIAPQFCYPQTIPDLLRLYASGDTELGYPGDPTLIRDALHERTLVTAAFQELARNNPCLKNWYYGHYHKSHVEWINSVKFKLLNIREMCE